MCVLLLRSVMFSLSGLSKLLTSNRWARVNVPRVRVNRLGVVFVVLRVVNKVWFNEQVV